MNDASVQSTRCIDPPRFRGIVRGRLQGRRPLDAVHGLAVGPGSGSSRAKRIEGRQFPERERRDQGVVGFFEAFVSEPEDVQTGLVAVDEFLVIVSVPSQAIQILPLSQIKLSIAVHCPRAFLQGSFMTEGVDGVPDLSELAIRFGFGAWAAPRHGSFLVSAGEQAPLPLATVAELVLSAVVFFPLDKFQIEHDGSIPEKRSPIFLFAVSFYSCGTSSGEMISISR